MIIYIDNIFKYYKIWYLDKRCNKMKDVGINVGLWFYNFFLILFLGYFIVIGLDLLILFKFNIRIIVFMFFVLINIWFFKFV